ncbi:MAG: hypothetical protein JXB46_02855 [Candidatus Eisenbacteria bacterium]|nr:hypothetical protein [Candidatus Eisenbacteria bacterium]
MSEEGFRRQSIALAGSDLIGIPARKKDLQLSELATASTRVRDPGIERVLSADGIRCGECLEDVAAV